MAVDLNGASPVPLRAAGSTPPKAGGVIPEGADAATTRRRDTVNKRLLAVADVLSAALAVVLGVSVIGQDHLTPLALAALPIVVLVSKIIGLYDHDEHLLHKTTLDEAPALFQVATLYAFLLWLSQGIATHGELGRDQVVGLWLLLFIFMMTARPAARKIATRVSPAERILVIGDLQTAENVRRKIDLTHAVKGELIGRVPIDPDEPRQAAGTPVLGRLETLGIVLMEHEIHRAVIAPGLSDTEELLHLIRQVKSLGVKVSVLPRLFEVVGSGVEFDQLNGMLLLGVRRHGLTQSSRRLKRVMDVTGSSICLLVFAPLMLWIGLAIKLTSRGPVFFRQARVGLGDREFQMLKFRTMVEGADVQKGALRHRNEAYGLFKITNDPRITRVGGFLRRTSLDELPQLLNVLKGEMSLVGPRPLIPDEDRQVEGFDRHRLNVKPGMTGMWQIFGSSRIPLHEMVKIDYLYGVNWSPWLDLKILARTVPYAVGRRGL